MGGDERTEQTRGMLIVVLCVKLHVSDCAPVCVGWGCDREITQKQTTQHNVHTHSQTHTHSSLGYLLLECSQASRVLARCALRRGNAGA